METYMQDGHMFCSTCDGEVCKHTHVEAVPDAPLGVKLCLDCGKAFRACEVYSRVVGYLRPTNLWNKGKKEEFVTRKTYKTKE